MIGGRGEPAPADTTIHRTSRRAVVFLGSSCAYECARTGCLHTPPSEPHSAPTTLTSDERKRVARWAERRTARAGDQLVSERATGYFFFVIDEGTAVVSRERVNLHSLGPGDFFGELAITGDGRRTLL